jgi:hypothetical protein
MTRTKPVAAEAPAVAPVAPLESPVSAPPTTQNAPPADAAVVAEAQAIAPVAPAEPPLPTVTAHALEQKVPDWELAGVLVVGGWARDSLVTAEAFATALARFRGLEVG